MKATLNSCKYEFRTKVKAPSCGLMMVGLGGNNGTTLTAGLLANRLRLAWETREGQQKANFLGSMTQCSTVKMGVMDGAEFSLPFKDLLPMVDPRQLEIGGWDISGLNLYDSTRRARVLEPDLIRQLKEPLSAITPSKAVYYKDFIASNQEGRADNTLRNKSKLEDLECIRQDIRRFKEERGVGQVVVLWTGNTERMALLDCKTEKEVMEAIARCDPEVSPSLVYGMAAALEGCPYINGSPQNTVCEGLLECARRHGSVVAGNDLKTGQTKFKSCFVQFLIEAGIKPRSIVSYNHLGNNDGKNLAEEAQFKSKETTKKDCTLDQLAGSGLY